MYIESLYHVNWRLGCVGQPGNRFRFRLRLRCVRACEAVCGRVRDDGSPGARAKKQKWGAPPLPLGAEKIKFVFQDLIASG